MTNYYGRVFVSQPTGRTCRVETFADTLEALCCWKRTNVLGLTPASVQLAEELRKGALQSEAARHRDIQRKAYGESAHVLAVREREQGKRHASSNVDVPMAVRECGGTVTVSPLAHRYSN